MSMGKPVVVAVINYHLTTLSFLGSRGLALFPSRPRRSLWQLGFVRPEIRPRVDTRPYPRLWRQAHRHYHDGPLGRRRQSAVPHNDPFAPRPIRQGHLPFACAAVQAQRHQEQQLDIR